MRKKINWGLHGVVHSVALTNASRQWHWAAVPSHPQPLLQTLCCRDLGDVCGGVQRVVRAAARCLLPALPTLLVAMLHHTVPSQDALPAWQPLHCRPSTGAGCWTTTRCRACTPPLSATWCRRCRARRGRGSWMWPQPGDPGGKLSLIRRQCGTRQAASAASGERRQVLPGLAGSEPRDTAASCLLVDTHRFCRLPPVLSAAANRR